MDRIEHYYKQMVDADLMNGLQDDIEEAIWKNALDSYGYGIDDATGFVVTAQGTPDLTVNVSAGECTDKHGRHCVHGATQIIDCSTDYLGADTTVGVDVTHGRWVSVFAQFARTQSQAETDGNGNTVYVDHDESIELFVVKSATNTLTGLDPDVARPSLPAATAARPYIADAIRLCDIALVGATPVIATADIRASLEGEREDFLRMTSLTYISDLVAGTPREAIIDLYTWFDTNLGGLAALDYWQYVGAVDGQSYNTGTLSVSGSATVKKVVEQLIADIAAETATEGAAIMGIDAFSGAWGNVSFGATNLRYAIRTVSQFLDTTIEDTMPLAGGIFTGSTTHTDIVFSGTITRSAAKTVKVPINTSLYNPENKSAGDLDQSWRFLIANDTPGWSAQVHNLFLVIPVDIPLNATLKAVKIWVNPGGSNLEAKLYRLDMQGGLTPTKTQLASDSDSGSAYTSLTLTVSSSGLHTSVLNTHLIEIEATSAGYTPDANFVGMAQIEYETNNPWL